jgi:hypothetical protein
MKFEDLIEKNKSAIVKSWFDLILDTYPAETAKFLKKQKDRFANPVGFAVYQGIEGIFDQVCHEIDPDTINSFLDRIVRVRAIQEFSPSQAVGFIFLLKHAIREELKKEIRKNGYVREMLNIETKIDELALMSFNIYMECREKLYDIKFNEVRNKTYSLLKKANFLYEIPETLSDIKGAYCSGKCGS